VVFPPRIAASIKTELARAEDSRKAGLEGRARVCARRAAGLAAKVYFQARKIPVGAESAYNLLRRLSEYPQASPTLRQAAARLVMRVNEDFRLPIEADLVAEARWLIDTIEQDTYRNE
jgi:hypothetical protein